MPGLRRFAAPALAVLVALGASGCAGMSFNSGCGMGLSDPMADGASRMNRGYPLSQLRMQHQAAQSKALMAGAQFNRGNYRKPGQTPIAPSSTSSALCFR
ncbi:MAG TPA: hypothetical protein VE871_20480 [Longimicrobium sp.]|nr:hypothetical protein [Longimicrobium sp.]